MSEIPALRDALVRAGMRRRRRRRAVGAAVPTFAAVAAAVFLAAPHERDRERVVAPSASTLAVDFSVFGRAQTADDRSGPDALAWRIRDVDVDPALTRHVGGDLFALGTRTGDGVCLTTPDGDELTGECASVDQASSLHSPLWLGTESSLAVLVPNGTRDATAAYADGSRVQIPVSDNAIVAPLPERIVALSWTTPRDVRRVLRLTRSSLARVTRGCQGLGPLPDDAEVRAARVALNEVDLLHPSATTATIRATGLAPESLCPGPRRSVEVTLRTDATPRELRVLVGVLDGRLQPYRVNGAR